MRNPGLLEEKRAIERQYGEWTAHNIYLGDDVFTLGNSEVFEDEIRLRRIVQAVADTSRKAVADLRILDLACLEGLFAIEFARHGADVVAIEGRRANIEKCLFAKRALGLQNVEFHLDDVRNLSEARYGRFDVVLCLGILYHLNDPDFFMVVERISEVCLHSAIVESRISLKPEQAYSHRGRVYWGRQITEHPRGTSIEEKERKLWSSLNNAVSIKLTRRSLYSLLWQSGFSSVYECHVPQEPAKPRDRITLVAIKGKAYDLISCPQLATDHSRDLPEKAAVFTRRFRTAMRLFGTLIPKRIKDMIERALGTRVMDWTRPSVRNRRRGPS